MNLNGIAGTPGTLRPPQQPASSRVDGQGAPRTPALPLAPSSRPVAAPSPRDSLAVAGAANTLPAEPPPGTDPELWSVLSADERAFFARAGAMGPLTYGRMMSAPRADVPIPRGGRLDVRG